MRRRTSRSVKLRRKNRRQRAGAFCYHILCVALVGIAAAVALTVFFKIECIEVVGTTRYTPAQIQQTLGAKTGDNLFFWGKAAGVQRVRREYPYVSRVRVRRQMPNTLRVEVTECTAFAAVSDASGTYLISADGKLLEKLEDGAKTALPHITGVSVTGRAVGEVLGANDDEESGAERTLVTLLAALRGTGQIQNVDFINLTNPYEIHIGYLKRFDVRLGSTEELARKLQFLNKIVGEKLSPSDVGVLELSNVGRMYFWPDTLANVQAAAGIPAVPIVPAVPPAGAGAATDTGAAPAQGAPPAAPAQTAPAQGASPAPPAQTAPAQTTPPAAPAKPAT